MGVLEFVALCLGGGVLAVVAWCVVCLAAIRLNRDVTGGREGYDRAMRLWDWWSVAFWAGVLVTLVLKLEFE